ncbi:uncharacterized protein LOC111372975 [Olea europaea var. sylvestris]|uniref:uncharacterized protein LOC111372975 n=1 Tax=Olea europaea var. sylvestris TaxID=158386 RepID=UPI000C1CEC8E|nr:uncharacterized protein LOC111372975 [Olea europaea var. sylvestris]
MFCTKRGSAGIFTYCLLTTPFRPDIVFEAVGQIPYDKQLKQVPTNGSLGFLLVGGSSYLGSQRGTWRPQDIFLDTAIQLQLVFAQWIQNTYTLASNATAPGKNRLCVRAPSVSIDPMDTSINFFLFMKGCQGMRSTIELIACCTSLSLGAVMPKKVGSSQIPYIHIKIIISLRGPEKLNPFYCNIV